MHLLLGQVMISHYRNISAKIFAIVSFFLLFGCSPLIIENPPAVQPYLNHVYILKNKLYAYQDPGGIWGGIKGLWTPPDYFVSDTKLPDYPTCGTYLGIIPAGTKYLFTKYVIDKVAEGHGPQVQILEGEFAGKTFEFSEDALLKSLNLNYTAETSPFAHYTNKPLNIKLKKIKI